MAADVTQRPDQSPLIIGEPRAPLAELLVKNAVLLPREVDDLKLAGVEPAPHPQNQEPHSLGTHHMP